MRNFFSNAFIGAITGLVIFLSADYISTKTSDKFKKTIFEAGYRNAISDVRTALEKKDTILNIQDNIDEHWEKVKVLYKNGR